jgi:eukaryotic-like serine/threonine-protein kinase
MEVAAEIMRSELGTDLIGQTLDGYTITGRLGAGGMGQVYRAHDSRLGRDVAIKVLPTELAADPDRLSRFDREARALAALNHPNIATIHGIAQTAAATSAGPASTVHAIVLELVEGETLSERLARAPVPLNEALGIARQIAEALDAAHERGIIHRDLKPSNIKIRPDGRVKVLDFGLAKLVNQVDVTSDVKRTEQLTVAATQPGLAIGTAPYMSPEQVRGLPVDKRTDIWAFGCIVYEMLAARPAFGGATTADTMSSVLEREPDWSALPTGTPPDVMSLVHHCLDKDLRYRLRDIGDSQRVLSGIGDARQQKPVGGRLPWIPVVASLAAVALGVWYLRPSSPRGPIQTTHSQITIPDNGTIAAGFSNTLAVAPDGRKIAMVVEVNQKTGVWVKALEESTARFVPGSDGAQFVLWSPDSKSLAFRVLYSLLRFDLTSSAPVVIAPMPIGPTFGADWGDDGTSAGAILFFSGSGLMRVSGSGGEPVAIGVTDAIHPQMLPRGRFFYTSVPKGAVFGAPFDHPAASVEILKEGAAPVYASRAGEIGKREDGFLLWIRGTTLLAQTFDPTTMRRTGKAMVLADPVWTVAVSPSVLLYDPAPAMSQFAWVDRNGKVLQVVGDPAPFGFTTLSPDGSRVVVTLTPNAGTLGSGLWMLDTQRGVRNRFVADIGGNTSPAWSPDGQTVLFGSGKGLTRIATSGVGDPDPVHSVHGRRLNPTDWSRRGFVLFNQFDPGTEMNIMMLPVTRDGTPAGQATAYLQKPGAQSNAHFSPDGGWVAYEESAEAGQSEVFIDTFPERRRAIQISTNGGFGARWNPHGGEVFYRSPAGKLMAVSVKLDKNSADVSTPRELFTLPVSTLANLGSQYDVGPDGKRFLIQVAVKKAPLELITNWQALLK